MGASSKLAKPGPVALKLYRRSVVVALTVGAVVLADIGGWAGAAAESTGASALQPGTNLANTAAGPFVGSGLSVDPVRSEGTPTGNPLWAVPLARLSLTRERP